MQKEVEKGRMLTHEMVSRRRALIEEARCDRETRVVARTLGGVQCGLAGMGSGIRC